MVLDQYYDYIVVGSGPGGATVARELASQKKRILIVEYGPPIFSNGVHEVNQDVPRALFRRRHLDWKS